MTIRSDMEQAAAGATAAGMVVFAASGGNDSSDGGPNPANVDLPASAPQANDPLEHEADRVADQVMRMPDRPAATSP